MVSKGVGRHHARTSSIGNDHQPRRRRTRLPGQQFGAVEEFGEGVDAFDTGAFEGRTVNVILADDGPVWRWLERFAAADFPRFQGHNRFDMGNRPGRAHEFAEIGQLLEVHGNAADALIIAEKIDQIGQVRIQHAAGADKIAEANLVLYG